jgi:hypothetical protein
MFGRKQSPYARRSQRTDASYDAEKHGKTYDISDLR